MKIVFAGGGTGGHIYPAISIAKEITEKNKKASILFIGSYNGLENKIVPAEGFTLKRIRIRGFLRSYSIKNIVAVKELIFSFFYVQKILKDFQPDIVIGTGGYVSGSVLMMASLMKIPTLIHEQNAFPGVTNRILSRFVDRIALTFQEAIVHLPDKGKISVTGNPLRNDIIKIANKEGKKTLGFSEDIPLIFIVGGSRGAKKLNESSQMLIKESVEKKKFQVLHMTGETQYTNTIEMYKETGIDPTSKYINVAPYIYNMPYALAGADLIISRCGAGLISEITALGKPSILIPYPYASGNHQESNARALEKQGAAIVILEKDLNNKILLLKAMELLEKQSDMEEMSRLSKELGRPNATKDIIKIIEELLNNK